MSNNLSDTRPLPIPPEQPHRQRPQTKMQKPRQNPQQMQHRTAQQRPYSQQQAHRAPQQRQYSQQYRATQRPYPQNPPQYEPEQPDFETDEDMIEDYDEDDYDYAPDAGIRRPSFQGDPDSPRPQRQYQQPPSFDYEPEKPPKRVKKRKKRRRKGNFCLRRIIGLVMTLAAVIFGIYSGIVLLGIKMLKYEPDTPRNLTESMAEPDEKVHNLMLVITDGNGKERGKADCIMLVTTSSRNHTITVTSLMPDSFVVIPQHDTDKLSAAYTYGGATLLMDTIVNNFGIPVDDNICINFKSFINIADALGGVKISLSDDEARAINSILQNEVNKLMDDAADADLLPSGGTFLLNGKQALAYARIRVSQTADFLHTQRQREVMTQLLERLKHPTKTSVPKLFANALPDLTTNMKTGALYLRALQAPITLWSSEMQTLRLPADDTFSVQTAPDGQTVLAVNFEKNLDLYKTAIREEQASNEK